MPIERSELDLALGFLIRFRTTVYAYGQPIIRMSAIVFFMFSSLLDKDVFIPLVRAKFLGLLINLKKNAMRLA